MKIKEQKGKVLVEKNIKRREGVTVMKGLIYMLCVVQYRYDVKIR